MWAGAALLLAALGACRGQVLTPPIFNLAENKQISATATCGEDVSEPELYCQLTGGNADKEIKVQLIQGQVSHYCLTAAGHYYLSCFLWHEWQDDITYKRFCNVVII